MSWQAKFNYARISPYKVRLIIDMIRDRDVTDALNILKFTPNRAAGMISKVLRSAVANADNDEADVESLFVKECYAGEGPKMKRFQPKDRGRAHPIIKRTSHITVVVDQANG